MRAKRSKFNSVVLDDAHNRTQEARGALRAIFEERDSWEEYTDDYEDTMTSFTRRLFPAAIILIVVALFAFQFPGFPLALVFGLLAAGAAGSCVSVLTKMPKFNVALSAELESYGRRIFSRIAAGVAASIAGCALLAWGVLPISLQGQTFADCLASAASSPVKTLILLSVPMLLGFSERALTSLEHRMFGHTKTISETDRRQLNRD